MRKIFHFLKRSEGVRDSLTLTVGQGAATGLSAISLILLSRFLGPEQFGVFSVGFAILLIVSRLNDLGLTLALMKYIPKAGSKDHQNRIFSYAIRVKLIVFTGLLLSGLILGRGLARIINFDEIGIIYLAFILAFAGTAYEHLMAMLQSLRLINAAVKATAIQAGLKLISIVMIIILGFRSATTAFVVYMIMPAGTFLLSKWLLPGWLKLKLSGDYAKERQQLFTMAGHAAVFFLAIAVIDNLDILLAQRYLDTRDTGIYAGVSRIGLMFILASYSMAAALNPRVARYSRWLDMRQYLKKAVVMMVIVGASFALFYPVIDWLIVLTIGSAYLPGEQTLAILVLAGILAIATVPLTAVFYSMNKGEWYFSIGGLMQIGVLLLATEVLVPVMGMEGVAWARVMTKASFFLFTLVVGGYYIYQQYREQSYERYGMLSQIWKRISSIRK
jgi:O-antigen/teichoic acid export membrane protein